LVSADMHILVMIEDTGLIFEIAAAPMSAGMSHAAEVIRVLPDLVNLQ